MSVPERPQKQTPTRSKPAPVPAQSSEFIAPITNQLSPASLISLQRMIGNQAVRRMITPSKPQREAISQAPSIDSEHDTADSSPAEATIQRAIAPLPGKSSGLFKGRRDKINAQVAAYNILERQTTTAAFSVAAYQKLLSDIQKIKTAAATWQASVATAKPTKAADIGTWITTELDRETAAKQAQMGEHPDGMKAVSDGASYNAQYATPAYMELAGTRWLETPALAPIYKYFMIQQHEEDPLNAYLAFQSYRKAPSRAEATRIYTEYQLGGNERLNISGEGVPGQIAAVNATRQQFTALMADPAKPVPANFGSIELSVNYVINSMFLTFTNTDPFKKIVTPPKAK